MDHIEAGRAKSTDAPESDSALINQLALSNGLASNNRARLLEQQNAPQSDLSSYGIATAYAIAYLPSSIINSVEHNFKNPLYTASTFGMGAGMALALKALLPEGGPAGKLAAAAIGTYFTYKAAEPVFSGYRSVAGSKSMLEIDQAARQISGAAGHFVVDSAIAMGGYKLGSNLSSRLLSAKFMDGFADAKAGFYDKLSRQFTEKQVQASSAQQFNAVQETALPQNFQFKSLLAAEKEIDLTVILKSSASELKMQRTLARIAQGRQAALSEMEFLQDFAPAKESLQALKTFAESNGLKISSYNPASGKAVLSGNHTEIGRAFSTRLAIFESFQGDSYQKALGGYRLPDSIRPHFEAVLGLETGAQAKPHYLKLETARTNGRANSLIGPESSAQASGKRGYLGSEVADAYNFPKQADGKGQSVAIIQLGGGFDPVDNARFYRDNGLRQPQIEIIEVSGAKSKPGHAWDSEVMLDSQIIGTVAPGAKQNIIFAPNGEKGFVDAVLRAGFPEKGESRNSVLSISWGLNESGWSKEGISGMHSAFKKLALQGISIFASAGDDGAFDRSANGKFMAHYPASDPHVTANGGTRLYLDGQGRRASEQVWNNGRNDAGGGGISEVFALPEYQKQFAIPPHAQTGQIGRGLPDITGNGDPISGYRIRVHGAETVMGGTSAVAPLYAALMLRINSILERPFTTPLNPWLYQAAKSNPGIFNDILAGDNGGYKAGPGWDAASGLGSLDGSKLLAQIKADPYLKTAKPADFRYADSGP